MQQTKAKPSPKSDKKDKKAKKDVKRNGVLVEETPRKGQHQPFAAIDIFQEAAKKEEEEKAAAAAKKAADKQAKKEAEDRAKRANIYAYLDDVKKRHTDLPQDLLEKMKVSKTAGEAKRLLKDYLVKRDVALTTAAA